ncbi:MAG: hypothetical protein ACE5QW_06795 [Thermoplasmata archaeon]
MVTDITASDIISWFREDIAPKIGHRLEIVPHGGTALALRGLKGGTKDVDINTTTRGWFDELCKILESIGYKKEWDLMAWPGREHNIRYVSERYVVDTVGVHFPTWNNWYITDTMKRRADHLKFGELIVVLPDPETIFLFKTYPCRETDIVDLDHIQSETPLDVVYLKESFEEQETLLRNREDIDPVVSIVNLRVRFRLSLSTLRKMSENKRIGMLHDFASIKSNALDIRLDDEKLAKMLSASSLEWERYIHRNHGKFSERLGL